MRDPIGGGEGNFGCPGQLPPGIFDPFWAAIQARDPLGASWGPQPVGLWRWGLVNRFQWNSSVAAKISNPVLILHGKKDAQAPIASAKLLCDALPGGACAGENFIGTKKIMQTVNCASHIIPLEGCSGSTCKNGWKGPHATVAKSIGDFVLTGKIFASPGQDNGAFETMTDGTNRHIDEPESSNTCTCDGEACDPLEDGSCP